MRTAAMLILATTVAGSRFLKGVEPDPVICEGTVCGELSCPPPGKVKEGGNTCCPVCEFGADVAPTYDPAEMASWYGGLTAPNEDAPTECKGAFCGTPLCAKDFKPNHSPGDCC